MDLKTSQKTKLPSKVYTSFRGPDWANLPERIPLPVWDRFRRGRWRLLAPLLRRRVQRRAAGLHWIFILGCSNSGTTLLSQTLSLHPEIGALPYEGQFLTPALPRASLYGIGRLFSERPEHFHLLEGDRPPDGHQVLFDWLRARGRVRRPFLVVKSPPDMMRTRWLQAQVPRCSFIAIVRNGFAVSEGISRRQGCDVQRSARHWARAHEFLLEDSAHLRRFHLLRYEDLCEQPLSTLEAVARFLGVDERPLRNVEREIWSIHNVSGQPSRLKNFNLESLKRLSIEDREIVLAEAGPVLAHFGYGEHAVP
jgi:hypothetical protein